jgi:crotonobetainyl-CoA:carnitine CoA-transferase CaiB-like acyl-CoA transferase
VAERHRRAGRTADPRARRTGVGCDADVSLFEAALAQLTYLGTWVASRGYEPRRMPYSAHQSMVPFQNFRAADGWLVIACPKESLWRRLCVAIGRPDLAEDPRFAAFASRNEHRDALVRELHTVLATDTVASWITRLEAAGVPCGPINDVAGALADVQAAERGVVQEVEHPELGTVRQVGSPLRVSGEQVPLRRGPFLGEHTRELLGEVCGYSAERLDELARSGALGPLAVPAPR